jgi:hypothetical protein
MKGGINALHIYPNPAKNSITIEGKLANVTKAKLVIADMSGNRKAELDISTTQDSFKILIDIGTWNTGIYFVTISDGKMSTRYSFIKQ